MAAISNPVLITCLSAPHKPSSLAYMVKIKFDSKHPGCQMQKVDIQQDHEQAHVGAVHPAEPSNRFHKFFRVELLQKGL